MKQQRKQDSFYTVDTPEGIALRLSVAGPVVRALAWLLDFLIRMGVLTVAAIILSVLDVMGMGIMLIVFFLLEWAYPVYFEVLHHGATPGKKLFGIYVLHDNGTPIGFSASMLRNLLRTIDFLPFLYGFAVISMLLDRHFRRLGDLVAATVVIYQEDDSSPADFPEVDQQPIPYPLTLNEQQAILDFAQRSHRLSTERADELAQLSGVLVDKSKAKEGLSARDYLYGMANHLIGKQIP